MPVDGESVRVFGAVFYDDCAVVVSEGESGEGGGVVIRVVGAEGTDCFGGFYADLVAA